MNTTDRDAPRKLLRLCVPAWHADDAARMVRVCRERGYEVAPLDAMTAFRWLSESKQVDWIPLRVLNDEQLFTYLMTGLEVQPALVETVSPPPLPAQPPKGERMEVVAPVRPAPLGGKVARR